MMPNSADNTAVAEKSADRSNDKRRALGRGLESLLPAVVPPRETREAWGSPAAPAATGAVIKTMQAQAAGDEVMQIPLDLIDPNPYQTRMGFSEEQLAELAESIRVSGVVQPIVVRPGKDGRYILILGERRCRASKLAGKETIPAILRPSSEQQAAELTVIENLQRQDLNCLEQAEAFWRLSRNFGLTQEEIGKHVGVSRESISNYMRVLKLPESVIVYLRDGKLGFSEARELLTIIKLDQIAAIAEEVVQKHLSIEQLRERIKIANFGAQPRQQKNPSGARWVDPNVRAAQRSLEEILGVRVRIKDKQGRGTIRIEYSTLEDFDRVMGMLKAN